MVHENREILTHNSRRFLVICQFNPETYTFTASADVPSYLLKRKKNPSASSSPGLSNNGGTSTSASVTGPTGTKPLSSHSKDLLVDETSVSSFHEYATSVTASSSIHPYASTITNGKSHIQHLQQRDSQPQLVLPLASSSPGTPSSPATTPESRSNFLKLRSPLTSVTRAIDSHGKFGPSQMGPVNKKEQIFKIICPSAT